MCTRSQFLCSYHKQEYTQCYVSCMNVLVYYSQFGISIYIITLSRCSGVAGSDVQIGTNPYSHSRHLQFMRLSFVVEPFHSWTWRYPVHMKAVILCYCRSWWHWLWFYVGRLWRYFFTELLMLHKIQCISYHSII